MTTTENEIKVPGWIVDLENVLAPLEDKYADPNDAGGWLIRDVVNTASWRIGKALEYPDDNRNRPAAENLAEVATALDTLPDDDPGVVSVDAAWDAILDAEGELPSFGDDLRAYGFGWGGHGSYYPDAAEVLARLLDELKHAAEMTLADDEE
jgi:hypothetical protein